MTTPYCVVYITVPRGRIGDLIAKQLVRERLAACVNSIPAVRSFYRWEGKIETGKESLLIIKTRKTMVARLIKRVKKLHPYSVPEVISLPIVEGLKPYLDWIKRETPAP